MVARRHAEDAKCKTCKMHHEKIQNLYDAKKTPIKQCDCAHRFRLKFKWNFDGRFPVELRKLLLHYNFDSGRLTSSEWKQRPNQTP